MSDDLRRARAGAATPVDTIALVSSARRLPPATQATRQAADKAIGKPEKWQGEGWVYYDTLGELRFACTWYSNALSRVRLTLARRGKAGEDPTPLNPDEPADAAKLEYLDDLGTQEGQAALLSAFAPHLVVPGVAYLVAIDPPGLDGLPNTAGRRWVVLSQDEIRTAQSGDGYEVRDPDEDGKWVPTGADFLPVKVWRPHARYHWMPDSPVRPLLPVLRELALLTAHVEASATSRLAGAGVLFVKKGMTFQAASADRAQGEGAPEELSLVDILGEAMVAPIGNRDDPRAMVPIMAEVPLQEGEDVRNVVHHMTFSTEFDQSTIKLREEARVRFAGGMDVPPEVLLGVGDANHWTSWQIEEGAIKLHIVPMCQSIVDGLTTGWLTPLQEAAAALPGGAPVDEDLVVWFDTTNLTVRPDKSEDAFKLYDLQAIGLKALLRETSFNDEDKPTDEELTRALLIDLVKGAPTLFPIIAPMLGLQVTIPDAEPLPSGNGAAPAAGAVEETPANGPPATAEEPPPPPDEGVEDIAASAAGAALLEATDGLVWRALEHAGNRLRNRARQAGPEVVARLNGVDTALAHTLVDASDLAELGILLDGAWRRAPEVAERHGVEPDAYVGALDRYAKLLLAGQLPHSFGLLVEHFDPVLEPVPA